MGTSTTSASASPEMAVLWAPRVLAVASSLFFGVFALDAFDDGVTPAQAIGDFLMHLLPSATLLGIVALAWRREWIGALVFAALAVVYAIPAYAHLSWVLTISGPLLVVSALYAWSWNRRRRAA